MFFFEIHIGFFILYHFYSEIFPYSIVICILLLDKFFLCFIIFCIISFSKGTSNESNFSFDPFINPWIFSSIGVKLMRDMVFGILKGQFRSCGYNFLSDCSCFSLDFGLSEDLFCIGIAKEIKCNPAFKEKIRKKKM